MLIIETPVFTRRVDALLTSEEYRQLQQCLAADPGAGAVIPGSGGLRKLRWGVRGRGRRGGARVIYYCADRWGRLLLLLIYAKSDRDDLTQDQLEVLRKIVQEEYP